MRRLSWLVLSVAAACSGGGRGPAGGAGGGSGVAPTDAAPAPVSDAPPPGPSVAACEALVDHVLEVGLAEQRAKVRPELAPTADDVAAIRAGMADQMIAACRGYDADVLACAMAASSSAAIAACDAQSQ